MRKCTDDNFVCFWTNYLDVEKNSRYVKNSTMGSKIKLVVSFFIKLDGLFTGKIFSQSNDLMI